VGDSDLSAAGRPGPERPRGLVVLPGAAPAPDRGPSFLRRWRVLVATLTLGVIVVGLIALLWSRPPAGPNPSSLPPALMAPAVAIQAPLSPGSTLRP
jgi:hypothetical protein